MQIDIFSVEMALDQMCVFILFLFLTQYKSTRVILLYSLFETKMLTVNSQVSPFWGSAAITVVTQYRD